MSNPDDSIYALWARWSARDHWARQPMPEGLTAREALQWADRYAALHPQLQVCCLPAALTFPVRSADWCRMLDALVLVAETRKVLWAQGPDTEHNSGTLAALAQLLPFEEQQP